MIFDELWRLRWQRDRTRRKFIRRYREAQKEKDHNKAASLAAETMREQDSFNDEIYRAETNQLGRHAERLGLPVPDFRDKTLWVCGHDPAIWYLNPAARTALRQEIRRERRERRESAIAIAKDLAVPIIGIIATIVSLILASKIKHSN